MNTNKINRYDMYKYLNIFLYWKFIHFSGLMVSIYNILLHHFKIKNSKKIKKNNEKFNANFLQDKYKILCKSPRFHFYPLAPHT